MVDGTDRSFRNNIKYKFSPQVIKNSTKSKKSNMANLSYVSSLFPPIPAKLAKEVNKISKYFKKQPSNIARKSYTQVSANSSNSSNVVREMLKIKEAFSSLQNKKIEIVQKIISGQDKPKLKIHMTTKSPSCYDLKLKVLSNKITLVLSNTRELDRVPNTK